MKPFEEIVAPYQEQLKKLTYTISEDRLSPTIYLFQQWAYRVEKGWYGFDLEGVPFTWANIIDAFMRELAIAAPKFKIHQIKLKFGGLRFYVDLKVRSKRAAKEIYTEIGKLEAALFHEKLIY